MSYEELSHDFIGKTYRLLEGCGFERYSKLGNAVVDTFSNPRKATIVGLSNVPKDVRLVYKNLIKEIESLKNEDNKEINFMVEINNLLLSRKQYLESECGDYDEEILFDAEDDVIRLTKIYQELYRVFVFFVEQRGILDKIGVRKTPLSPEMEPRRRHFKQEAIFKLEYIIDHKPVVKPRPKVAPKPKSNSYDPADPEGSLGLKPKITTDKTSEV